MAEVTPSSLFVERAVYTEERLKLICEPGVMVHIFNPSTQASVSLRVQGQSSVHSKFQVNGLHNETLSEKKIDL